MTKNGHIYVNQKKWVKEALGFDETQERNVMSKSLETPESGFWVARTMIPLKKKSSPSLYS
jgi:hypothetical protein